MLYLAVAGWFLAVVFFAFWLHAARLWNIADTELTYLLWQKRMRDERMREDDG